MILVVGGTGKIGSAIKACKPSWAFSSHREGCDIRADVRNAEGRENLVRFALRSNVTTVVILVGQSSPDYCEIDPITSNLLNCTFTYNLVQVLSDLGIYSILFSTEYVYNKLNFPERAHKEENANPICEYGRQKLLLEQRTEGKYRSVLRLPKVVWTNDEFESLYKRAVMDLTSGSDVSIASDQFFTPLNGNDLVSVLEILHENKTTGVFNLGQSRCLSRAHFYELVRNKMIKRNIPVGQILNCSFREHSTYLPMNTCLDSHKFSSAFGYTFSEFNGGD